MRDNPQDYYEWMALSRQLGIEKPTFNLIIEQLIVDGWIKRYGEHNIILLKHEGTYNESLNQPDIQSSDLPNVRPNINEQNITHATANTKPNTTFDKVLQRIYWGLGIIIGGYAIYKMVLGIMSN